MINQQLIKSMLLIPKECRFCQSQAILCSRKFFARIIYRFPIVFSQIILLCLSIALEEKKLKQCMDDIIIVNHKKSRNTATNFCRHIMVAKCYRGWYDGFPSHPLILSFTCMPTTFSLHLTTSKDERVCQPRQAIMCKIFCYVCFDKIEPESNQHLFFVHDFTATTHVTGLWQVRDLLNHVIICKSSCSDLRETKKKNHQTVQDNILMPIIVQFYTD